MESNADAHSEMQKPNFFIIGAPKCGTTSLASWLYQHPSIYMSPIKEPHYFNFDDTFRNTQDLGSYERLFRHARPEQIAIGEASTWYLTSKVAVAEILQYQPDAKFIVMLRNPVDLVHSLHQQNLYAGFENIEDVCEAWEFQQERLRTRNVPRLCRDYRHLIYGDACSLGDHVQRLLQIVDANKVHFIFLEDMSAQPESEYLRVLDFLSIEDTYKIEFSTRNSAKINRSKIAGFLLYLGSRGKKFLGVHWSFGLHRLNIRDAPRQPMTPMLKARLAKFFEPDVRLLSSMTGRNLDHWLHQAASDEGS